MFYKSYIHKLHAKFFLTFITGLILLGSISSQNEFEDHSSFKDFNSDSTAKSIVDYKFNKSAFEIILGKYTISKNPSRWTCQELRIVLSQQESEIYLADFIAKAKMVNRLSIILQDLELNTVLELHTG